MKSSSLACCAGVSGQAGARGLSVPDDLAVIGFGDQEFAAHTEPGLTTIGIHRQALGRKAADALLAGFETGAPSMVHDVGFELIRRGSA